ncbi:MAG TPA: hypothetical protein VFE58_02390 [Tepidisphaeraceae bacterium]|jgi:hypothetical protein|nr:hypothetical protein [Tepidisphaeraceae bacterium]
MQCASCQFENMPGSQLCGRCGTSLSLSSTTIDIHPPRAGRWTKRVRRLTPKIPVRSPATDALRNFSDRATSALNIRLSDSTPAFPLLARIFIPGWPQLFAGSRILGRFFLFTWVSLLSLWLLFFYGTTIGSMLLGLAFSTHSSSVADATNRILEPVSMRRRMFYSICTSALLFGLLYLPASRILFRYAEPVVLQLTLPPFQPGDVVLINHSAFARQLPQPGQVVLFTPPDYRIGGTGHNYTLYTGPRIDRILAGPRDKVRWSHHTLFLNGVPTLFTPLNPTVLPPSFECTVPAGVYFIVPSATPILARNTDSATLLGMSYIALENINGTAYLLSHPLYRLKALH